MRTSVRPSISLAESRWGLIVEALRGQGTKKNEALADYIERRVEESRASAGA